MGNTKYLRMSIVFIFSFVVWSVLVFLSYFKDRSIEREKNLALAKREALTTFNKDHAVRLWSTDHGGVYVPVSPKTSPNPYLKHIPERDITTPSGRHLTLMNPAYMIRQIMADYEKQYGTKGHITSLKPLNPINDADSWEREALLAFEKGKVKEVFEISKEGNETFIRLMKPMIVKEGCLKCHGIQGYKAGEVRGGVGVKLNMRPYQEMEKKSLQAIGYSHGILWLFGIAALFGFTFWEIKWTKKEMMFSEQLETSNAQLEKALNEVKTLRGIIPICSYCKKIRDDKGYWNKLEEYILSHSEAMFSHSACPECYETQIQHLNDEDE